MSIATNAIHFLVVKGRPGKGFPAAVQVTKSANSRAQRGTRTRKNCWAPESGTG